MAYLERISDLELKRKLGSSGAVLVRGPKACGKTESAKQIANSFLYLDRDDQVQLMMDVAPKKLLEGNTPRLIDEWQVQPKLWDYIRHEVDDRQETGQFILTGSANPVESVKMHSGAGRFTIVDMRTMSWQELGYSSGKVSLNDLFNGVSIDLNDNRLDVEFIVEKMIIGGFPSLVNKSVIQAMDLNRAYIDLLAEIDINMVSGVRRDPNKVRSLLKSLSRNTSTVVDISSIERDIFDNEKNSVSRPTVYDYLDALERLMIIENQPAWNVHLRSTNVLRQTPKRHFTDVSLAIATMGANANFLLDNLNYTGFLFESQVVHDLRVYAQANDAKVFHYRDSSNLEVDAIIQKQNGKWCAFEIKLGTGQIEEAATNLKKFEAIIDTKKSGAPTSLNIITGTGMTYTRKDGINVISLASLGV